MMIIMIIMIIMMIIIMIIMIIIMIIMIMRLHKCMEFKNHEVTEVVLRQPFVEIEARDVSLTTFIAGSLGFHQASQQMAVGQNLVPLVNIKIAGKWMFIPLKMVLIGIDPYPSQQMLSLSSQCLLCDTLGFALALLIQLLRTFRKMPFMYHVTQRLTSRDTT